MEVSEVITEVDKTLHSLALKTNRRVDKQVRGGGEVDDFQTSIRTN
jgi:hypothetical protein